LGKSRLKEAQVDLADIAKRADGIQAKIQQTADVIAAGTAETEKLAADAAAQERQGILSGAPVDTTPLQAKIDTARRRIEAARDVAAELGAQTPVTQLAHAHMVIRSAAMGVIIEEARELLQRYSVAMRKALEMQWKIDAAVWVLTEHREDLALVDKQAPDNLMAGARQATAPNETETWLVGPFRASWQALYDSLQADSHARLPVDGS
jgi:hypothetical protein